MAKIKIEDMDHYDILNVKRNASFKEIEKAYFIGRATYSKESLAHYSLLKDQERKKMLARIESAFVILRDEEKRYAYDKNTLNDRDLYKEKARFRQSMERMIFEDPQADRRRTPFFRRIFSSTKKD